MSTKREEERNEKIIRGLMKLPPNRKCINCNSLGPQYVCTNFWTFVCMTCSGIHREFTHRVKSVSMAKFTTQEVEALQQGGNQRAREIFLKDWDMQRMRLPDNSNAEKIRQFIKDVYVSKKYSGGSSSNKPPRDTENMKNHEDQRRASSYHSYSQSPPYDYQYEDRRYGKQPGMLSRKPGSDRVQYEGKIPSFIYSPGRVNAEDRFANEGSGSRMSDFSVSSAGDTFRFDGFSPNSHDAGYFSPSSNQSRDIIVEENRPQIAHRYPEAGMKNLDGIPRPKRTASSGSFGSSDSNPISHRSVDSVGNIDVILEPVHSSGIQQNVTSVHHNVLPTPPHSTSQDQFALPNGQPPSVSSPSMDLFADFNNQPPSNSLFEQKQPSLVHSTNLDLFSQAHAQTPNVSSPSLDLFANFVNESSSTSLFEQKPSSVPVPQNEGWATFDLPQHTGVGTIKQGSSAVMLSVNDATKGTMDVSKYPINDREGSSIQNSATPGNLSLASGQWNVPVHEDKRSTMQDSSQLWNAFDSSIGEMPPASVVAPASDNKLQDLLPKPAFGDLFTGNKLLEVSSMDGFQVSILNADAVAFNVPLNAVAVSPFASSVTPIVEGNNQVQKSTNPFDDTDLDPSNAFLDMGSLEAALPNSHVTSDYLAGLTQPWYSQNPGGPFMPTFSEGGLQYVAGQSPNLELPSVPQGPVSSLGNNPFA